MGKGEMIMFDVDDKINLVFSTEELDQCCEELIHFMKKKFEHKIKEFISKNKKYLYNHISNHNFAECEECHPLSEETTRQFNLDLNEKVGDFVASNLRLMAHVYLKKSLEN